MKNGTSQEVGVKVARAVFKAQGDRTETVSFTELQLALAIEYGIDIYSGNAEKVFGPFRSL